MIPGGKTIHDMVLDSSHKAVAVPGVGNGLNEALETATAGGYTSEWNDDLESGKIKA